MHNNVESELGSSMENVTGQPDREWVTTTVHDEHEQAKQYILVFKVIVLHIPKANIKYHLISATGSDRMIAGGIMLKACPNANSQTQTATS